MKVESTVFRFSKNIRVAIEEMIKLMQGTLTVIPVDPDKPGRSFSELQSARITLEKPVWEGFIFFTSIKGTPIWQSTEKLLRREVQFFVGPCEVASLKLVGLVNPDGRDPKIRAETAIWCVERVLYFKRGTGGNLWGDMVIIDCEPQF